MEKNRPTFRGETAYLLWREWKDEMLNYSFLILTPDGSKITTAQLRAVRAAWGG